MLAAGGAPRLVERLVANLVGNALRHDHPSGYLHLRTGTRDGLAYLSISNTGTGTPLRDVDELFQPFRRRADHVGDGLGLGRSIVQPIADAHRAIITTKPRLDGGLFIEVSFPSPPHSTQDRAAAASTITERHTGRSPAPHAELASKDGSCALEPARSD